MTAPTPTDGRKQRAERHKEAVLRALLRVVREQGQVPTVADLAERAGVSRRTVFRLFDDMESLHVAATALQRSEVIERFPPPFPLGQSLDKRVALLVSHRAGVYEFIRPLRRVAEALKEQSTFVLNDIAQTHRELQMHAVLMVGDALATEPGARQRAESALGLATGFSSWRASREEAGLSVDDAKGVMETLVRGLFR
ncbi:MAG: TetR/AcrR family transcriptional regulator [Myxococcota bacterium]